MKAETFKWKQVEFETMLRSEGEIRCEHWLLNNKYKTSGVDLRQPMRFNKFLEEAGKHLTSLNCKMLFLHASWYIEN